MIEDLVKLIPSDLAQESGKVFYSGRKAFESNARLYLVGFNPGGDPAREAEETVQNHTRFVLEEAADGWSAYLDEAWLRHANGEHPLQRRIRHSFAKAGLDLRMIPASNLIFVRSRRAADLGLSEARLLEACWRFHEAVLAALKPDVVLCLGGKAREFVLKKLRRTRLVDQFREQNDRKWKSEVWHTRAGIRVCSLTHPGVADWTAASTDPTGLIVRSLA